MNILIAGPFSYGSQTANALRVRGVAASLLLSGHQVSVIDNNAAAAGAPTRPEAAGGAGMIQVTSVDEYGQGLLCHLPAGVRGLFIGDVSARHIRQTGLRPDCIILYGPHLGYLTRFRRLCEELQIPLVLDIVEWYQPEDLPGGRFGPHAIANEISMRHATKRADGVIVLSSRLEQHYRDSGRLVVSVPPMFEAAADLARKWSDADGRLHLCYAGSPVRKEALGLILTCLQRAHDEGLDFKLHAVGMQAADLEVLPEVQGLSILDSAADRICFYGQVPNTRAREIVAGSDFTLLLRPLRRANQFGFPSKLCESMAVGTPVIANDFSDLGRYLVDGDNAIFTPHLSREAVMAAIRTASGMSADRKQRMAHSALELAKACFSPAASAAALSSFVELVS